MKVPFLDLKAQYETIKDEILKYMANKCEEGREYNDPR